MRSFLRLLLVLFSLSQPLWSKGLYDPVAVYLTWQRSPETTMTIQWVTANNRPDDLILYRPLGGKEWLEETGDHHPMPLKQPYFIHGIELVDLRPDTMYEFRTGSNGKIYKFRTLPDNDQKPIRFVVGGDMYHGSGYIDQMKNTCLMAAGTDPMFALIGGDIAYSANRNSRIPEAYGRWLLWLQCWKSTMIRSDGALIPILPAIGNHEVNGGFDQTPIQALFFYSLFPTPGPQGYNAIDFGNYMSIFFLDSGHTHPVEGKQTQWLDEILRTRAKIPTKFALYHVPAWPSCSTIADKVSETIRDNWVPVFEKYQLTAAFENHCHTYKRTFPLINYNKHPDGVLYIGDGAWGVKSTRIPQTPQEAWYIAKSASIRHFILVTVEKGTKTYQAVDQAGKIFDEYKQK
jgi:hypothetical protein